MSEARNRFSDINVLGKNFCALYASYILYHYKNREVEYSSSGEGEFPSKSQSREVRIFPRNEKKKKKS